MNALIAQAASVDTSTLIQYGALGVIAALALGAVRVLFARETKAHDLEHQRADRLEEEVRKLNAAIQDRYIATLNDATRVMAEVLEHLKRENR